MLHYLEFAIEEIMWCNTEYRPWNLVSNWPETYAHFHADARIFKCCCIRISAHYIIYYDTKGRIGIQVIDVVSCFVCSFVGICNCFACGSIHNCRMESIANIDALYNFLKSVAVKNACNNTDNVSAVIVYRNCINLKPFFCDITVERIAYEFFTSDGSFVVVFPL